MLSGLGGRALIGGRSLRSLVPVIAMAFLLLALLTAALVAVQSFVDVGTVTIVYLIAVLFAAIRGGVVPAVITAVAAVGAAAFFFYEPIYDFRVHNPVHLIDLVLFIIVAVVTGKLATDVRKAKGREEADALREALIGSVSHELRTPLSTIMGSASVLAQSPDIAKHPHLAPLVQGLREEAERLNGNIQNLLDATRISNEGIRPHPEWVDPGDVINAAAERKRALLGAHELEIAVAENLPLVQVDPVLMEKALGQLIENGIKYSPAASPIRIIAERIGRTIRIAVQDQGSGFSIEERERLWQRFYRGPRHRDHIPGSGLGLWIAHSLVTACGGRIEAFSPGIDRGATLSVYVPIPPRGEGHRIEAADE